MASSLSTSMMSTPDFQLRSLSGCPLKAAATQQFLVNFSSSNLSLRPIRLRKSNVSPSRQQHFLVRASYSDDGSSSSASLFVGGFVLGGIIVGTLGCVYAPQISRALAGADKKDLMRKLPKFIYDEDKALEKTRRVLAEKIAQLNSAIDDVSSQLRAGDEPNGVAVTSDEVEAAT